MKQTLQIEQAAQLLLAIVALYYAPVHIAWWLWPFLFLAPDLSMLGYLAGPRIGAFSYNLFHHIATAAALILLGHFQNIPVLEFLGLLLWAHSSFDRTMGYGLKYDDGFKHTHLGSIGKDRVQA